MTKKKLKTKIPKLKQQTSWGIEHDAQTRQVNNILAAYQRAGIDNLEEILLLEKKGIDCFDAERYAKAGFNADVKTMIELYKGGDTKGVWCDRTERLVEAGFYGNKKAMLQLVDIFDKGRNLEYISSYAEAGFKGNLEAMTALYKASINPEQITLLANHGLQGEYKGIIKVHKLLTENDISYDALKLINDNFAKYIEEHDEDTFEDVFVQFAKERDIQILFEKAEKLSKTEAISQLSEAIDIYHRILRKYPDNQKVKTKVLDWQSYCYSKLEEYYDKAEDHESANNIRSKLNDITSKLIVIHESEPEKNNEKLVKLYYNRAIDNIHLERYDKSISDLKRVLESIPNSYLAHYYLGYNHEEINDYEEAKKNYQRAKEIIGSINPLDRETHYQKKLVDINSRLETIDEKIRTKTEENKVDKDVNA